MRGKPVTGGLGIGQRSIDLVIADKFWAFSSRVEQNTHNVPVEGSSRLKAHHGCVAQLVAADGS